jgi:NADPH:quinone reductase-like Zn-dependent oxidoreductase
VEDVSRFIEAGQVSAIIDRTYPLAEVRDAIRHLEAGDVRGKIVITI